MNPTTNYIINLVGNVPDARNAIREISYFRHASDNMVSLLINYSKIVTLRKHEVIIKQGEFDQWIYIILSGVLDVYINEHKIDTVSVAMVGEKCILGETRKATLKAHTDEVIMLGIDMAILDELVKDTGSNTQQNSESCIEFLCSVATVVYGRLCQLWFYQVGKKKMAERLFEIDLQQRTILALNFNLIKDNKDVEEYITFFLQQHLVDLQSKFIRDNGIIDTRKLCLYLQQHNLYQLFDELTEGVSKIFSPHLSSVFTQKLQEIHTSDLNDLSNECFLLFYDLVSEKIRFQNEWNSLFIKDGEDSLNCYRLLADVQNRFEVFSIEIQQLAVLGLIKIFAEYNDRTNKNTGKIIEILKNIRLKEIHEDMVTDPLSFSMTGENLISSFDNVNDNLISPYFKALNKINPEKTKRDNSEDSAQLTKKTDPNSDTNKFNQDDIDQLFN